MRSALCPPVGGARADTLACEEVERYRLPNGVDVVVQVDHSLPLVAVVSSIQAGLRYEPPGYEGLAHYVEHLLFRGGGDFAAGRLDPQARARAWSAADSLTDVEFELMKRRMQTELIASFAHNEVGRRKR